MYLWLKYRSNNIRLNSIPLLDRIFSRWRYISVSRSLLVQNSVYFNIIHFNQFFYPPHFSSLPSRIFLNTERKINGPFPGNNSKYFLNSLAEEQRRTLLKSVDTVSRRFLLCLDSAVLLRDFYVESYYFHPHLPNIPSL